MAEASSSRGRRPENGCHLPPGLSASSIRPALGKILNSRGFVHSDRMKRFLQFIVRKTLDGHGGELKEYLVGVEVYDRPETFDPRGDSIVRVEARRLRGKLEKYYQEEGRDARVVVELEKGGYTPRFRMTAPPDRTPKRRDWKIVALAGFVLVSAILMAWAKGCAVVPVSKATGAAFSVLQTALAVLGESSIEPSHAGHVKAERFEKELAAATRAGLSLVDRPVVPRGRAVSGFADQVARLLCRMQRHCHRVGRQPFMIGGDGKTPHLRVGD